MSESVGESSSASLTIKAWMIRTRLAKVCLTKLAALKNAATEVQSILSEYRQIPSIETCEKLMLSARMLTFLSEVVQALPPPSPASDRKSLAIVRKKLASSYLIVKFPVEVLGDHAEDGTMKAKVNQCIYAAKLLCAYVEKLILRIMQPEHKVHSLRFIHALQFSVQYFLTSFEQWKQADAQRLVQSLEEGFLQSHQALLSARNAILQGQGDENLIKAAEMQVKRIGEMLLALGKDPGPIIVGEVTSSTPALSAPSRSPNLQSTNELLLQSTQQTRPSLTSTPQAADGPNPAEQAKLQKYLGLLSAMAGVENERIAHEILIDKNYRLPFKTLTSIQDSDSVQNTSPPFVLFLRRKMLCIMADRLVNSLRKSNVKKTEDIEVDHIIPVKMGGIDTEIYTAKVLAIAEDRSSMEIELLAHGEKVLDVPLSAIKLTAERQNGAVLLLALQDLCEQIAQLTPSRKESFLSYLLQLVQGDMWLHMVENEAVTAQDVLKRFVALQDELLKLHAEYRLEGAKKWLEDFVQCFYEQSPTASNELWQLAHKSYFPLSPSVSAAKQDDLFKPFEEILPLIPLFLERSVEIVEEIQYDTANYYISLLVPVLNSYGGEFLSLRFQQRLSKGQVKLDTTLTALLSLLQAGSFNQTVSELIEADFFPSTYNNSSVVDVMRRDAESLTKGSIASMLISLLKSPIRLDSPNAIAILPATLVFDAQRLARVRDTVDKICLECCAVIGSRQILQSYRIPPSEQAEGELQHRLDALLSEQSAQVNRTALASEVYRYIEYVLLKHEVEQVDFKEVNIRIEQMLSDIISENNMVWQLFQKRLYKILLRAMLNKPYAHKLQAFSLHSTAQERNLSFVSNAVKRVFEVTLKVHGGMYKSILERVVEALPAQEASSTV